MSKQKRKKKKEKKQKKLSCIPKSFAVARVDFIPAIERITNYHTPALIVAIVNLRSQVPCLFKMLEELFAANYFMSRPFCSWTVHQLQFHSLRFHKRLFFPFSFFMR